MRKSILSALLFLTAIEAIAACNTGAIVYKRETGFSLSFGSDSGSKTEAGDASSINVPLTINDKQACFRKKSTFTMKAENSKDIDKGSIIISPLKVEFENVPDPSTKQYLFVEKSDDRLQTKFHLMSFICAGEIPLSIEGLSDSYLKLMTKSNSVNMEVHQVFATGRAAQILGEKRGPVSSQETFDFFGKLYKDQTKKELDIPPCCGQKVPSILSDLTISSLSDVDRKIASSFTTLGARVPNGCSKEFSGAMSKYLLENYEQNDSLKDYKVGTKGWFSKDLTFEWK